jgi:hypothetical protein
MIYTELLRIRNAMKWTAIVLGVILAIAGVARLATLRLDALSFVQHVQHEPDSKVSTVTLPDGTKRTTIVNDREQTSVTIDDRGYDGEHIVVLERASHHAKDEMVNAGTISVRTTASGQGEETIIDTNDATFFADFALIGLGVALIVATLLGAPFARENDGHLEIAMTKPVGRLTLATRIILLDSAAIVASFVVGVVFATILHLIFQSLKMHFTPADLPALALGVVAPLAWYAMLNAVTASMKRGFGLALGLAWPAAFLVIGLAKMPGSDALRAAIRALCNLLSYADPFKYVFSPSTSSWNDILVLAVLALVYGTLAAFQWRRVEA